MQIDHITLSHHWYLGLSHSTVSRLSRLEVLHSLAHRTPLSVKSRHAKSTTVVPRTFSWSLRHRLAMRARVHPTNGNPYTFHPSQTRQSWRNDELKRLFVHSLWGSARESGVPSTVLPTRDSHNWERCFVPKEEYDFEEVPRLTKCLSQLRDLEAHLQGILTQSLQPITAKAIKARLVAVMQESKRVTALINEAKLKPIATKVKLSLEPVTPKRHGVETAIVFGARRARAEKWSEETSSPWPIIRRERVSRYLSARKARDD